MLQEQKGDVGKLKKAAYEQTTILIKRQKTKPRKSSEVEETVTQKFTQGAWRRRAGRRSRRGGGQAGLPEQRKAGREDAAADLQVSEVLRCLTEWRPVVTSSRLPKHICSLGYVFFQYFSHFKFFFIIMELAVVSVIRDL